MLVGGGCSVGAAFSSGSYEPVADQRTLWKWPVVAIKHRSCHSDASSIQPTSFLLVCYQGVAGGVLWGGGREG